MESSLCHTCCFLDPTVAAKVAEPRKRWGDIVESSADCHTCLIIKQGVSSFIDDVEARAEVYFYPSKDSPTILAYHNNRFLEKYDPLNAKPRTWKEQTEYIEFHTSIGAPNGWRYFSPSPELDSGLDVWSLQKEKVMTWLDTCTGTHNRCAYVVPPLPTRVICVGSHDSDPYLFETKGANDRYISLSHRWGSKNTGSIPLEATTTIRTIDDRMYSIPLHSLPQTFRDAIIVARTLSIEYVWIDSLCIIQDSKTDWAVESSKMHLVYANATLTIAADGALNCHEGLFHPVQNARNHSIKLRVPKRLEDHGFVYCRRTDLLQNQRSIIVNIDCASPQTTRRVHLNMYENHLSERAWTLQETLLSSRILHFTHGELIWECNTGYMCECQANLRPIVKPTQSERGFYLPLEENLLSKWKELVQQYTHRAMTFESDRLPALSGIAGSIFSNAPGSYACGLRVTDDRSFISQLLWKSKREHTSLPVHKRHAQYHAPTWSWASVTGAIAYEWPYPLEGNLPSPDFSIEQVNVTPSSENCFGSVKEGGYLKVTGLLRKLILKDGHQNQKFFDRSRWKNPKSDLVHVVKSGLPTYMSITLDVDEPDLEISDGDVVMLLELTTHPELLVLKPIDVEQNAYQRVGIADRGYGLDDWEEPSVKQTIYIF